MNKKRFIIVGLVGTFIITLALLGVTYAYYLATITWSSSTPSITASTPTGTLQLTFHGPATVVSATNIYPGWSSSVKFDVQNTGTLLVRYNLKFVNVSNTVSVNNVYYTLTCTGSNINKTDQSWPVQSTVSIQNNISIASGVKHECTFTATYKNNGDQTGEMGANKSFSATITIEAAQMTNDNH